MAVPAHDERDFEFAKKYDLDVSISVLPNLPIDVMEEFQEYSDSTTPRLTIKLKENANQNLRSLSTLPKYWSEDGILINDLESLN